jgi:hypothetical protein
VDKWQQKDTSIFPKRGTDTRIKNERKRISKLREHERVAKWPQMEEWMVKWIKYRS